MLKKTITFNDLDGKPITEDFYFNLSKAEIAEMELSQKGGLGEYLKKIVAAEDGKELVSLFKDLLQKSVGKRSEDGRRFIKNQDIINDFMQTNAYSELFIELATNSDSASKFITGIVPQDLEGQLQKSIASTSDAEAARSTETLTTDINQRVEKKYDELLQDPNWEPNKDDLLNMSKDQLQKAFARKNQS